MFSWQGEGKSTTVSAQTSQSSHDGVTSPFQVSQLRWLPSVSQRNHTGLSPLSSEIRQMRPSVVSISHVVEPADSEISMSATSGAQSDEPNSDSRSSPRDAGAEDAEERVLDFAPTPQVNDAERQRIANVIPRISLPAGAVIVRRDEDYASRNHGKRLTTKEEMSLFEICNRYAATFGERNKLCEWWRIVTDEFTREQGHPYSWHSVRRKVEVVTKQRMKFLAEQKETGREDMSNSQWREVIDNWVPNWERFEEAEKKRIEIRDSRRGRKRKDRSSDPFPWQATPQRWTFSSPSITTASASASAPPPPPPPAPAFQTPPAVKLPAGYDTMFGRQAPPATPTPLTGIENAPSGADPNVTSAVLETLTKLNKHLDLAASHPSTGSPVVSALAAAAQAAAGTTATDTLSGDSERSQLPVENETQSDSSPTPHTSLSVSDIAKLKEELREELRNEMQTELKKDRKQLEERLDSIQQTQEMILEMLRQEPGHDSE